MAYQRLWGLTLLERNLRELEKLGIREVTILTNPNINLLGNSQRGRATTKWAAARMPNKNFVKKTKFRKLVIQFAPPKSLDISIVALSDSDPFESLRSKLQETQQNLLAIEANALNDRRILEKLTRAKSRCAIILPNRVSKAGAAVLSPRDAQLFNHTSKDNLTAVIKKNLQNGKIPTLDLSTFKSYINNLRRDVAPFLILVEDSEQLKQADEFIRQTVHKGTNDFVAKYIHPSFEFGLTRILVNTSVTPNQITTLNLFLSIAVAFLFATGNLLAGIILAMIKGVLDGVDGKLARLTLKVSKAGDFLDHVTDTIFDAIWYLALGWHFSTGDLSSLPATFTLVLFVSYCVERIVPGIFKKLHGREIYDYARIDRFARLIGSRINNNIWFLLIGTLVGWARESFYFVSIWMLATAAWHTFRLFYVTRNRNSE